MHEGLVAQKQLHESVVSIYKEKENLLFLALYHERNTYE